ncbi:hypothetical protein G6F22_019791 [Rhizopus arrhizus]|nr:hypothetical protein G6F22_019791 [Rhizopus arrhizus]
MPLRVGLLQQAGAGLQVISRHLLQRFAAARILQLQQVPQCLWQRSGLAVGRRPRLGDADRLQQLGSGSLALAGLQLAPAGHALAFQREHRVRNARCRRRGLQVGLCGALRLLGRQPAACLAEPALHHQLRSIRVTP